MTAKSSITIRRDQERATLAFPRIRPKPPWCISKKGVPVTVRLICSTNPEPSTVLLYGQSLDTSSSLMQAGMLEALPLARRRA